MGEKDKETFVESARRNLADFCLFLYDGENKTVLGRSRGNWGQILVFYMFYYAFLASLFAIAITIVLNVLDPYQPRFQTRLQTPGVTIQPRLTSREALTSDIKFNPDVPNSYAVYTNQMNKFLKPYSRDAQNDTEFFKDCINGKVQTPPEYDDGVVAKACTFYREVLGKCGQEPYGYDEGKPCILVKINRIINWFPIGFTNLDKALGNEASDAPNLKDVLMVNDQKYNPYKMYVSCYGKRPEDRAPLNSEPDGNIVSKSTVYFPKDNGVDFKYYPYLGKLRQPQYLSPLVAVQFTNVTRGVSIKVGCKAYALNIVDDVRLQVGYFSFFLEIDQ